MNTSINSFIGRIAASRARSFLVYQPDMPRHSLCGFLRFIPKWVKQAIRVADARKNKFLEAFI